MTRKLIALINKIPGRAYLLLATLIFAASNSVTRQLTDLGAQNLVDGRNPISFCNVLFVGNLCALGILLLVYGGQCTLHNFKQLSGKDWFGLILVSLFSGALAPALIFMALDLTAVNNVILIGRIEPPLALALSFFILKERLNTWVVLGAIISFFGVFITILLQDTSAETMQLGGGFSIGRGELMAAFGAISVAVATIVSKISLQSISLGLFSVVRNFIGTIIFFIIVIVLYPPDHFMDAFSPLLWKWMLVYAAVIVVGGQLLWLAGLKTARASEVSLVSSFSPIAGILASYLILLEVPTKAQYIGGFAVVIGIVLNQIGIMKQRLEPTPIPRVSPAKELDIEAGYKGI